MLRNKKCDNRAFLLDFPARGSIAVLVDGLLQCRHRPPGLRAGLVVVQASRLARCGSRGKMAMANKQTRKQPKNLAQADTGEANEPARKGKREPRRRDPRARSGSVVQSNPADAATALPEANAENSAVTTTNDESLEQAASQSEPKSEGAAAAAASLVAAEPPPASTKRAMLIGMLERTQGASVGEIGQRLGWLPHTVRAAITGLRHAGREVTRSKDENGQSVYRLAPVEAADR
jgi:Protein of unknown function (DUF3489)